MPEAPETTAIASWFGSNRILAPAVGARLVHWNGKAWKPCPWTGVGFAGGMCELVHIQSRSLVVNDLHRGVINLARVIADPALSPQLYRRLRRLLFHADVLAEAQERCKAREVTPDGLFAAPAPTLGPAAQLDWAVDYFVVSWMGRSGLAGGDKEFDGGLSVRYDDGGGDSATRYRSAVRSLLQWKGLLERCTFTTDDIMGFIAKVPDRLGNALYLDPPFPGAGVVYKHKFIRFDELAARTVKYKSTRVVIRFYDHPTVSQLFPEGPLWRWDRLAGGRKSSNASAPEVLLVRGGDVDDQQTPRWSSVDVPEPCLREAA